MNATPIFKFIVNTAPPFSPSVERFATVTDKELAKLSEGLIPANTNTIVGGIYVIVIVVVASHRFVKMNAQSLVAIVL